MPVYLTSQRVMVGFDVVLLLLLPLLLFSVYTFQSKGNFIVMLLYGLAGLCRWVAGVVLLAGGSGVREGWDNLWEGIEGGNSPKC